MIRSVNMVAQMAASATTAFMTRMCDITLPDVRTARTAAL